MIAKKHTRKERVGCVVVLLLVLTVFLVFCLRACHKDAPSEPHTSHIFAPENREPTTATLVVCGDTMSHMPITNDAWDDAAQEYDYRHFFAKAKPLSEKADYAVANLETTFAGGPNYSGYPAFNTPDEMADALKDAGFDLFLTANNHCMDKGFSGLCRTLDVLDQKGLAHVGTSRTQEEAEHNVVLADVGGISVAFVGFTYGTNGIPLPSDAPFSVNLFNKDYKTSCQDPDNDRLLAALSDAKTLEPDLIAVMIHWGVEYQTQQNAYQEKVADFLFANGADIVLGGHSHVLQPMESKTVMRDGLVHQGFVCYSLGNFISSQRDPLTDTTVVLELNLMRDNKTGRAWVSDYTYHPMYMARTSGTYRFQLLNAHQTLADTDSPAQKEKCEKVIADCHKILGEAHDAYFTLPSAPSEEP